MEEHDSSLLKDYITKKEAARRLNVTPRTVENWIKSNKIRNATLFGHQWFVPEKEIQVALETIEVVAVEKSLSKEDLISAFEQALELQQNKITVELTAEIKAENEELREQVKQLEKKMESSHNQLIAELKTKQEKHDQERDTWIVAQLSNLVGKK